MERRQRTTENTDLRQPWDDTPITKAAWEKHRDCNREPPIPHTQPRVLFELGELKGAELERCVEFPGSISSGTSSRRN